MAKIVLGIGTAHSPQLQLSPSEWELRAEADRRNPEHWYRGQAYIYEELLEVRGADTFTHEITDEKKVARHEACQRAIAHLAETLDRVSPDVCVIVGDDQHESFHDDNMPAMSIYWGATVDDGPPKLDDRMRQLGLYTTPLGNPPAE